MTTAPDGTIYWVERYSATNSWKGRLRKLAPDGIVTTVAGGGDKVAENGTPGRRGRARQRPEGRRDRRRRLDLPRARLREEGRPDRPRRRRHPLRGQGRRQPSAARSTSGGKASESYIDSSTRSPSRNDGTVYFRIAGYDVSPSSGVILQGRPERHAAAGRRAPARHLRHRPARRARRDQRLHAEPLDDDRRRRRRRRDVRRRPLPDPQGRAAAAGLRRRGPRAAVRPTASRSTSSTATGATCAPATGSPAP